jgi:hypothetical protein
MATFLLYWNPYFSSYKLDRFLRDFHFPKGKDVLTKFDEWDRSPDCFNWSVAEHEKAHAGDRFIFVKVGYAKPTGIVGVGHFTSEPYEGKDWSGQGRKTFYMDMEWETVINPSSDSVLPTGKLIEAVPEISWTKGKAGVEVPPDAASIIFNLWHAYLLNLLRLE